MRLPKIFKTRTSNKTVIPTFDTDVNQLNELREHIKKTPCPNCTLNQLTLVKFAEGHGWWEAQVLCNNSNCKTTGVINNKGVKFNLSGIPEASK